MIMTSRPAITTTRACLQHLDHAHITRPSVYQRRVSTRVDAQTNGTPKRASPYRLLTPTSFLSAFAPLHVQGWRLLPLPAASSSTSISDQYGDLQDRRIVRIYELDQASGWKRSKVIFDRVHDLSIELSVSLTIHLCPVELIAASSFCLCHSLSGLQATSRVRTPACRRYSVRRGGLAEHTHAVRPSWTAKERGQDEAGGDDEGRDAGECCGGGVPGYRKVRRDLTRSPRRSLSEVASQA